MRNTRVHRTKHFSFAGNADMARTKSDNFDDIRATILQMGQVAERIVAKCGQVIAAKDVDAAKTLERDDDAMDELHRELFSHLIDGSWQHGTEAAVDMTLVGRYYERFADHAVSVAHRVVYLVTGEWDVAEDHEEQEDRASELR